MAQALVFRAGELLCALPLEQVIETMRPLTVHGLAGAPAHVKGITIMRGVPTPVVDVAALVGGAAAPASRYVAVRTARGPVAFATGEVLGIGEAPTARPGEGSPVPVRLIAAVGTYQSEPLFLLRADEVEVGRA
jgi:purine-binding chemotaxis protein CheW